MIIMKFGGVSVDGSERIHHVASIVKSYQHRLPTVVVSALKGVTDKLFEVINLLKIRELSEALIHIDELQNKHILVAENLKLSPMNELLATKHILELINSLKNYVRKNAHTITAKETDYIVSFGERLSAALVAQALSNQGIQGVAVDSAQLIVCSPDFGNGKAILYKTQMQAKQILLKVFEKNMVPVVTGFYGATEHGDVATLGRGGSDYSASVLANVCDAEELIVWKEVDGVYTLDPKVHKEAKFLAELSYEEAAILARNGAKVLHPETMEPARIKNITIWVKNTFKPEFSGTKIY